MQFRVSCHVVCPGGCGAQLEIKKNNNNNDNNNNNNNNSNENNNNRIKTKKHTYIHKQTKTIKKQQERSKQADYETFSTRKIQTSHLRYKKDQPRSQGHLLLLPSSPRL